MDPVLVLTQRRVKNLQITVKKPLLFLISLYALLDASGEPRATEGSASSSQRATEGSASTSPLTTEGSASPPPNIVLILADDLGYGDCGVTNPESKIKTPHIDQLAKEGLSFSDAHSAASTCTPVTACSPVLTPSAPVFSTPCLPKANPSSQKKKKPSPTCSKTKVTPPT
jgi:hypothetical protein